MVLNSLTDPPSLTDPHPPRIKLIIKDVVKIGSGKVELHPESERPGGTKSVPVQSGDLVQLASQSTVLDPKSSESNSLPFFERHQHQLMQDLYSNLEENVNSLDFSYDVILDGSDYSESVLSDYFGESMFDFFS
eukprot:TRINITY_DN6827_c0_g2_i2.p1 TRINITY_DN6827_c0_g2~~TRINITY_DN6827_c0_g2_i2.p1  ORF type:complete len:134 (-),score=15.19 TRINITY_DN6827_c0_g2_i2:239-640(-)